ncbi:MAG: type II toxin-antitoxin system VapC family toxin [Myxococcota bacterium]|nr:type II toxin-antitoxin system VapC family toxin [Myxococcota bacterium]
MADVALDANVLVAYLDAGDVHHSRARALVERLEHDGHALILLDVCVGEAVSVVCRRARERKVSPPDLPRFLAAVRRWRQQGELTWTGGACERLFDAVTTTIEETSGALNFNDALLIALHRDGAFDQLASFDTGFDAIEGLTRLS